MVRVKDMKTELGEHVVTVGDRWNCPRFVPSDGL
jgi:hypothetical protein